MDVQNMKRTGGWVARFETATTEHIFLASSRGDCVKSAEIEQEKVRETIAHYSRERVKHFMKHAEHIEIELQPIDSQGCEVANYIRPAELIKCG